MGNRWRRGSSRVPAGAMVVEGHELDDPVLGGRAEQGHGQLADGDAQLDRSYKGIIGCREVLAVTADRGETAEDELLDREQRIAAELQATAGQHLPVLKDAADILRLPKPGKELTSRWGGRHGGAQRLEAKA